MKAKTAFTEFLKVRNVIASLISLGIVDLEKKSDLNLAFHDHEIDHFHGVLQTLNASYVLTFPFEKVNPCELEIFTGGAADDSPFFENTGLTMKDVLDMNTSMVVKDVNNGIVLITLYIPGLARKIEEWRRQHRDN